MICFKAATYHFHDSLEFLYQKKNAEEYPLHGTHFTDPYLGSCQVDFFFQVKNCILFIFF